MLVESERTVRGKTSCERRACISSLQAPAGRFFDLVRGHWHIENKLHWVLNTTFGEDRVHTNRRNALWKKNLKSHPITVVAGPGFGHRFMPQTGYDTAPVVREVTRWLDATFALSSR